MTRPRWSALGLLSCLMLSAWAHGQTRVADTPTAGIGWDPKHFALIGGGVLLATGGALGYSAQGEARRAATLGGARESAAVLDGARSTAATANLLYALAAITLSYALVLELMPPEAADATSLTFHF